MSGFVLAEEVSALEYNFEPYGGKGIIPEPSAIQIQAFRQALGSLIETEDLGPIGQNPNDLPREEFVKVVSMFLNRDTSEIDEKTLHMCADVCSGTPSFDELQTLPFRARSAFMGWLVGKLLLPEVPVPTTSNSVAGPKSAS